MDVCLTARLTFISKHLLTHSCIAGTIIIAWNEAILYFHSKLLMVVYIKVNLAFTDSLHMLHCEYGNNPQGFSKSYCIFMLSWLVILHLSFFFFPFYTKIPVLVGVEIQYDVKGTVQLYEMMLLLPLPWMTLDTPTDMLKIQDLSFLIFLCLILFHVVF